MGYTRIESKERGFRSTWNGLLPRRTNSNFKILILCDKYKHANYIVKKSIFRFCPSKQTSDYNMTFTVVGLPGEGALSKGEVPGYTVSYSSQF